MTPQDYTRSTPNMDPSRSRDGLPPLKPLMLSTAPYKGVRDFYPEEAFIQNYIFSKMRSVAESYGYVAYGASVLEETALYKAKSGEEIIANQTYSFTDRGERDVTLRPEMTPTVTRMIAHKRKELVFPVRWYSIPNMFRYERPQRGRLREHWQLNVDIFGADSLFAELELIEMARDLMLAFGAKISDFEIRINNRRLIKTWLTDFLGLDSAKVREVSKLLDRRSKTEKSDFEKSISGILSAVQKSLFDKVFEARSLDELPEGLKTHSSVLDLRCLLSEAKKQGMSCLVYDPSLVRGFDYYTGVVFEVYDTHPMNNRSLFGGGRYDELMAIFGAEKIPACGFGMGDVTIRDFMDSHGLLPCYDPGIELAVCHVGEEILPQAREVARELRACGLRVSVDLTDRKLGAQIKTAVKQSIPFVVVVGPEEWESKKFKVKRLKDEVEVSLPLGEIRAYIATHRIPQQK